MISRIVFWFSFLNITVFLCSWPPAVSAIDDITIGLSDLQASGWALHGIKLQLRGLERKQRTASVRIARLALPPPLQELTFAEVVCTDFEIEQNHLRCRTGSALLDTPWIDKEKVPFQFSIDRKKAYLEINQIGVAEGHVDLVLKSFGDAWQLETSARDLSLLRLQQWLSLPDIEVSAGKMYLKAYVEGRGQVVQVLRLDLSPHNTSLQNQSGEIATDGLSGHVLVQAKRRNQHWQWRFTTKFDSGAAYVQPVFLDLNAPGMQGISVDAQGTWWEPKQKLSITDVKFNHPGVVSVDAQGRLFEQPNEILPTAQIVFNSTDLETVSTIYLAPFVEATALQGLRLRGGLKADLSLLEKQPAAAHIVLEALDVNDEQQRFGLSGASGNIDWVRNEEKHMRSNLAWKSLELLGLPVDAASLSFYVQDRHLSLTDPVSIPLLDGYFNIDRFDYRYLENGQDVIFKGTIEHVSLEQATSALGLLPMSGSISGEIPGIRLESGKLNLDGALSIKLFNGEIVIKELAASHLFSYLPQFYADIEIDNLDLNLLTQKFSFGYIEGRLSGFINNLYMEDWQPVTFYAWLGTPDDDDSSHKISQKAVQNIVSIGGGGAADALSRGFLRFFETFGYQQLGIGCYLHQGVCQLMGVEAVDAGYYIVKGGGLPRINVIGYNPRVDWKVLVERLKRLSTTRSAVVQ